MDRHTTPGHPHQAQGHALRGTTGAVTLDDDQARVPLSALAAGQTDTHADLRPQPNWAAAEAALKPA
jgi:hypothetical protein